MVFAPIPMTQHGTPAFRMPPDLRAVNYVFIRHDAHCGPLRPPYDGPFRVLRHGNKCLVVDVGGRPETISWDRIKPANDVSKPMEVAQSPRRGRPPAPHPPLAVETPSTSEEAAGTSVPTCPLLPPPRPLSSAHAGVGSSPLPVAETLTMGEFWGGLCGG